MACSRLDRSDSPAYRCVVLQSYNGGSRNGDKAGYMNFLVDAPRSNLTVVKNNLLRIAAVTGARFGEQEDNGADW
jgi:hypothetical protein